MEEIKSKIQEILQKMGIEAQDIKIKKDNSFKDKEYLVVDLTITAKDAGWFLGERGEGLDALQHIIRKIVLRSDPTRPFLVIDINYYKKGREKELIGLASKAAQKVRRTKKPVVLNPMSPSERRIIHIKLAEYPDIVTESSGEEPERKVIIRPYP